MIKYIKSLFSVERKEFKLEELKRSRDKQASCLPLHKATFHVEGKEISSRNSYHLTLEIVEGINKDIRNLTNKIELQKRGE